MLCALWMRSPFLDREIVVGRRQNNAGAGLVWTKRKRVVGVCVCMCVCEAVQCSAAPSTPCTSLYSYYYAV